MQEQGALPAASCANRNRIAPHRQVSELLGRTGLRPSQCMQGESSGGGISRVAFRAYVNRYYSGPACQDVSISGGKHSGPSALKVS